MYLLICSVLPANKMAPNIQVELDLPNGWLAHTPWHKTADNKFSAPTRRELLSNTMFFGSAHHEQIRHGDYRLDLVLGAPYAKDSSKFTALLLGMLQQASAMFDSTPDRKQYLIIVNEGFADGGAFYEAWMLKRFETMYSRYAIGRYYQRSEEADIRRTANANAAASRNFQQAYGRL